ncbi:multifunctional CCA addition/repair protein [Limnohabitans sp. Rim47]|uniref:multifunctional CCA addition/repair protein n=1 Tax=Limnohabitans sp. Rim47 TaxID=1100721 RepID=UPI0002D2D71F|nr:multifunctional CCA addition/repair protein [Limnohabitans sp. Rim47]
MKIYAVGGAVRDALLGLRVQDRDWVVVGSTPEEMATQGFTPVGKDFPVFLHPRTREEYALARTERKTARGYKGFAVQADPSVTLEEDLARRDLTINAMAVPQAVAARLKTPTPNWLSDIIDPWGGLADLQAQQLRHVTPAFAEDPVRILRVARFAARFTGFEVAPETMALMQAMVSNAEIDHLVPERVWQELAKGLMADKPSRMFQVLRECGALKVLLPDLDRLWGVPQRQQYHPEIDTGVHMMLVMDMAARLNMPLTVRVACLMHDLGKGSTPADVLPRHIGHEGRSVKLLQKVCDRLRIPSDCKELAEVVAREHGNIHRSAELGPEAVLRLLERCDAIRQAERFERVLQACECDARGRLGFEEAAYPQAARLRQAQQAALSVDTAPIAQAAAAQGLKGPQIGAQIAQARIEAIAHRAH